MKRKNKISIILKTPLLQKSDKLQRGKKEGVCVWFRFRLNANSRAVTNLYWTHPCKSKEYKIQEEQKENNECEKTKQLNYSSKNQIATLNFSVFLKKKK